MYKKVITMIAWKRPYYTKQVVDNLKQCIGFEEYTLLPTIQPGYPEVLKVFDDIPNCHPIVNETNIGCGANELKALQRGFALSDYVIHLEDDTVHGIDSLKYFEMAYENYKDDKDIFTVAAYNKTKEINLNNYFTVYRHHWFTPWVWATWKDRFEEMEKNWNSDIWDHTVNRLRGNRYELCPNLSRSQNIGAENGMNATPKIWKKVHYTPYWVNNTLDVQNIYQNIYQSSNKSPTYHEIIYTDTIQQDLSYNTTTMFLEEHKSSIILGSVGLLILYLIIKNKKKDIVGKNEN